MVTSSISIQKSEVIIWDNLTDKDKFKNWYFTIPDFVLTNGSTFQFYEPGDKHQYRHVCTILEIVPHKKLTYTWTHPDFSNGITTVTWLLEEQKDWTAVTLQHEGIENLHDAGPTFAPENYQKGWDDILSNLKKFIDKMT